MLLIIQLETSKLYQMLEVIVLQSHTHKNCNFSSS